MVSEIGGLSGETPDLEGLATEADLLGALRLVIPISQNMKLPITHNGLGYNNLIFVHLVLTGLELDQSSQARGENAKVFSALTVEEPEAHLHPALQFKFLRYLKNEVDKQTASRQVFVTTHSTHITAAVGLDSIVCLERDTDGSVAVAYPGKVFSDSKDDRKSKHHVERFLDATRSTMLFAKGVLLVEGITEQLLMPWLARQTDHDLEASHVAVVRVDGQSFSHFLKLFGWEIEATRKRYALKTRVSCLVDNDPHLGKSMCWPFQHGDTFKPLSDTVGTLLRGVCGPNVRIFHGEQREGKSFEYDLAFVNPTRSILVTDQCSYKKILSDLMSIAETGDWSELKRLAKKMRCKKVVQLLEPCEDEQLKRRSLVAACYSKSTNKRKGEHAFLLAYELDKNEEGRVLKVPKHIGHAIKWACGGDTSEK